MKHLRRFILFLVVVLALAAISVATCPASFAWHFVANRVGAVKLDGISGSAWNGHASNVSVYAEPLGALDWQLAALPLLRGEVEAQVNLHGSAVTGSGTLAREPDGTLNIGDTTLRLPASLAAPALDIPLLQLLGTLDVKIAQLRLQGAWPTAARGSVDWHDAAVAGAAQAQLGNLRGDFVSASDASINGTLRDQGGPLQLNGTFTVNAGSYDARATLAARDGNPQVLDALRYIGQPQADGTTLLLIHGRLFGIF